MADVNWNLAVTPDPFKQIAEGADYSKRIFDQAALLQAGTQYAGGDYASAAGTLARRGKFDDAAKISDLGTARTAGAQYAAGDYAGAGKTYVTAGKIDEAGKLQDQRIKTVERQQDALGRSGAFLAATLKQYPNLVQRAWGIAKQQLEAEQIPPARIAEFEKMVADDPVQAAGLMSQLGSIKIEWQKAGDTTYGLDPRGNVIQTLKDESGGVYPGKSAEATDNNILLRAAKDPAYANSPEYALAYGRIAAPRNQLTADGKLVSIAPSIPAWAPQPGSYQGGTAPSAAPVSDESPAGVTSRVAPINPASPPTKRINAPPPSADWETDIDESGTQFRFQPSTGETRQLLNDENYTPRGTYKRVSGGAAANGPSAPPQAGSAPAQRPAPTPPPAPAAATPVPSAPNVTVTRVLPEQPKPNEGAFRDATPEEIKARGLKAGTRGQVNDVTNQFFVTQQPNENDLKTAGYARRLDAASQNLAALAQRGIVKPTAQILLSENNGVFRLVLSNPKDRQFVQASKEWLAPVLRKDTGAAVTDKEFEEYSYIYIPRVEDPPEVLAQKAAARKTAEDVLYAEAKGAYTDMFGERPARAKPSTARGPYAPGRGQIFIPKPSIDALRQNPQRAAEFDKKYGAGAAKSVLGR